MPAVRRKDSVGDAIDGRAEIGHFLEMVPDSCRPSACVPVQLR